MRLHMASAGYGTSPLRHSGHTPAPTPSGDCAPPLRSPWRAADEYYPVGNEPSPENFFERQTGPAYQLTIAGLAHQGFSDLGYVLRGLLGPLPDFDYLFGPLDSGRAMEIIRAYTDAFFDKHLRGQTESLLDGPSAVFPEVTFKSK
jgi:hypothetical protein